MTIFAIQKVLDGVHRRFAVIEENVFCV